MSYQVHNIERGDVIWAPATIAEDYGDTGEYDAWKVLSCKPHGEHDYRVRAVSTTRKGVKIDVVVNGGWSLCIKDYAPPTTLEKISRLRWDLKHFFLLKFSKKYREQDKKFREELALLERALSAGYEGGPLITGSSLKVESLEGTLKCVTYDSSHIKLVVKKPHGEYD